MVPIRAGPCHAPESAASKGPTLSQSAEHTSRPNDPVEVETEAPHRLARLAADAAAAKQATAVVLLDVGELVGITDVFVLASVSNDRQLRSVAEEVEARIKQVEARGPRRREGEAATGWMILDYGDVVVHAFTEEQRAYYDLERLWSDAPRLAWSEPVRAAAAGDESPGTWYAAE